MDPIGLISGASLRQRAHPVRRNIHRLRQESHRPDVQTENVEMANPISAFSFVS
ncbi:hypothetical protein NY08_59 [Rhodococcus sp. B7740]|nr:hypothetical protein NY08_59 [Rhodococcus sp. B7740]